MAQGGNGSYRPLCAAIFILLEIAALAMLRKSSTLQNIWINRASHHVMATLWGGGEKIRSHFSLEEQNDALALENYRLNEELRAYRRNDPKLPENRTRVTEQKGFRYIPATIVKASRNTAHNYIILNKGSEDGVRPHSGIISSRGVVGIIDAVDKNLSYGLTLMNNNVSISSRIGKEGIVAPLVWDGISSNRALLKDIPLHYDIHPGDTVLTSGFSSIFPPDIPVGTVVDAKESFGYSVEAEVLLFQDFSTVRYVTITENLDMDEVMGFENRNGEGQK